MRRIVGIGVVVLLAAGAVTYALRRGGQDPNRPKYTLELDNAFGVITGADLKIAGVRAGKITSLSLDQRTKRAIVGFQITATGFGSLRKDVSCQVLPQSLVGEYYIDCAPGRSPTVLPPGSRIPVSRTSTTVPPDLVGNIQRLPYRERLRLIINELGAAVAGNAQNLNAALRRASPALRETDRVLAILARQNQTLADLTVNADTVVKDLAARRTDVSRFVVSARDAAQASASRDTAISAGFRRLPVFLRELRPTMDQLGRTLDVQGPALQNLSRSANDLGQFLDRIGPFAQANRVALPALGRAAQTGTQAVAAATPTVAQLNRFATGVPELGKNLAIILEHLNSRENAVEKDPRSPGGEGYTGLEALLSYVYDQTMSTNTFDENVHILKVAPFDNRCADYYDVKRYKDNPDAAAECSATLGPNQPGINFPDVSLREGTYEEQSQARARAKRIDGARTPDTSAPAPSEERKDEPKQEEKKDDGGGPKLPEPPVKVPDVLPDLPGTPQLPDLPKSIGPDTVKKTLGLRATSDDAQADRRRQTQLLDYLFAP